MARTIEPDADHLLNDLAELATYVDDSLPGWSRVVLTDPYRASRDFIRRAMQSAGLDIHVDDAGNTIGRLPGRASKAGLTMKPLATGSHTDSVRGGGRFDGTVGVLGALEMVRSMRRAGVEFERDLLVIDFLGEEPNDYGIACVGSRAFAGVLTPDHLSALDVTGESLGAAMAGVGLDPAKALSVGWAPDSFHAYVELHIEQGPLMERTGEDIGVVTAIAGISRFLARFSGRADHAGATPMDARSDALSAAATAVLTIERIGCGAPIHGVTTTGRIESFPGSVNVVPESARLWGELRSTDGPWLAGAKRQLVEEIARESQSRGVDTMVEWLTSQEPVPTTPTLRDHIARSSERLGLTWRAVPSGAGHDAAHMAHLGPMAMIFVKSIGGRSHCPEELSDIADIVNGVRVLASTLLELDSAAPISSTT